MNIYMNFTKKDKAILIGLTLGDGYLNDVGQLKIEHGDKQEEYCRYKAALLHSVVGGKDIIVHKNERVRSARKDGKEWKTKEFTTYSFSKRSKSFLPFRELIYKDKKKKLTPELLDLLDETSLMLWWLDDGNLNQKQTATYRPGSYCLRFYIYRSMEECLLFQKWFLDKYGIQWNIIKSSDPEKFNFYCGVREGVKFIALFQDIVRKKIPSMAYKVLDIQHERRTSKEDDIV